MITASLLRASLWVAASAAMVAIVFQTSGLVSARIRRVAWGVVLLQGIMLTPWSLAVPWYPAEPTAAAMLGADTSLSEIGSASLAASTDTQVATVHNVTSPSRAFDWRNAFASVWIIGLTVGLSWMGLSYVALLLAAGKSRPSPALWQSELDEVLRKSGVRRSIKLHVHDSIGPLLCRLPSAWQIIVPQTTWSRLSRQERLAVLRHETAHYCRGDVWKSTAARSLAMIHWFNPAAWWANSRFDQCAEWSCDEQLAREDPGTAPALARALLHFNQAPDRSPLSAAVNGAPLCTRLKRLLQPTPREDSMMKRAIVLSVIAAMAVASAVRVRLVAQDGEPAQDSVEAAFAGQLAALQSRLPDDELLGKLKKALSTDEGKLVMRARASDYSEQARESAKASAYDDLLERRFHESKGKYELNPEHADFGQQLLTQTAEFEADVPKIATVLESIAENLRGDDETTRLVARFMTDEGAMMLYVHELRKRMRPTLEVVEYRLRQLMVRDSDGNYILREDHRDEAEQLAKNILPLLDVQPTVSKALSDWAEDLAEVDELHKRAKQALKTPSFGFYVAAEAIKNGKTVSERPRAFANRIVDQLEEATNESADGMVFRDETHDKVDELLSKFQAIHAAATTVRPMLQHIADRIAPRDELHQTWAKLLKSEIGALKVGGEIGQLAGTSDIRQIVMEILGRAVVEQDGVFRIAEEHRDEVANGIQKAIREHRRIRRYGRALTDFAEDVADPKIAAALKTTSAQFIAAMIVQDDLRQIEVDGLKRWMADYLQASDDGSLSVTAQGTREVESILAEAAQVREELKKDDF